VNYRGTLNVDRRTPSSLLLVKPTDHTRSAKPFYQSCVRMAASSTSPP
jgi:hypothetical protein